MLPLLRLSFDLNLAELLLNVVVPFTPILNWTLREFRKQVDTANALATLKTEFEKIWERAIAGAAPGELNESSRQLQDAIYQHRASSPLVFDWVYDRFRTGNEDEARHAAQRLVQQAKVCASIVDAASYYESYKIGDIARGTIEVKVRKAVHGVADAALHRHVED